MGVTLNSGVRENFERYGVGYESDFIAQGTEKGHGTRVKENRETSEDQSEDTGGSGAHKKTRGRETTTGLDVERRPRD